MRRKTERFFLLTLLLLGFHAVCAATLATKLDRNPVQVGQTFNLIISLPDNDLNVTPDLTPLQQDFQIISASHRQMINIINGKQSASNELTIQLMANKAGNYTIPALSIANDQSQTQALQVTSVPTLNNASAEKAFMRITVNPEDPYVQSEILYSVRIYYNVVIRNASLTPPDAGSAMIKQLGNDENYQEKTDGKVYQVFQRNYAIFPQESGNLKIAAPIFRGEITDDSNPDFNGFFATYSKPLQLTAPETSINVKAKPAEAKNRWWLPARHVSLSETWSTDPKTLKVGEPITRTLTLTANGLSAAQLPALATGDMAGVNTYTSAPKLENVLLNQHITGTRTEKIVYIPTQAGALKLPAIQVGWWNTKTDKPETVELPAQQLHILANARQTDHPVQAQSPAASATPAHSSAAATIEKPEKPSKWHGIGFAVTLLMLIVFVALLPWLWKKYAIMKAAYAKNLRARHLKRKLHNACLQNDAHAAKTAFLQWARHKWPRKHIHSIGDFLHYEIPVAFAKAVEDLNQQLYADKKSAWDGKAFWELFKSLSLPKQAKSVRRETLLPDLYLSSGNKKSRD